MTDMAPPNRPEGHDAASGCDLIAAERPRLLDLCCKAGGAGMGYAQAGFEVVGIDNVEQPRYPFEFYCEDALGTLERLLAFETIDEFAAIHASFPCQLFTAYRRKGHGVGDGYADLIEHGRELLEATGLPYVIENVPSSPLRQPVQLCGSSFDLDVRRHRHFEINWPLLDPPPRCNHAAQVAKGKRFPGATNREGRYTCEIGVWRIPLKTQLRAMGVGWGMTLEELSEAVPPRYTHWLGTRLLAHVQSPVEVAA